jgi:ABC-type multidrug transport system ATPase subunit
MSRLEIKSTETETDSLMGQQHKFKGLQPKFDAMSFSFKNLGLVVRDHTGADLKVLKGVTGEIEACSLVAVMGPSGAGKTTFMNVLSGRAFYGQTEGQVQINGRDAKILDHRHRIGFVPQDDIVHDDLTVEENLLYSAKLRLDFETDTDAHTAVVQDVLNLLQIEHIRHSIVGNVEKRGISGGQRKRVNIGLELCADPITIFLDEPTSGLDSTSSEVVLAALKDLTEIGLTGAWVVFQK